MKQKKKNRFFTFIFAFLPGAAEMYMGFMKCGLSLMLLFFLSFTPMVFFSVLESFLALSAVIWFFGFFHARNYATMDDQEFRETTDKYIWEEFGDFGALKLPGATVKKWIAIILIFIGVAQLWNYLFETLCRMIPETYWDDIYPIVRNIPQFVISVLFIVIGVRMIIGKKKELDNSNVIEVKQIPEFSSVSEMKQEEPVQNKEA